MSPNKTKKQTPLSRNNESRPQAAEVLRKGQDMKGVAFNGDVKDVCAELKAEAEKDKRLTVGEYLRRRKLAQICDEQLREIFADKKNAK